MSRFLDRDASCVRIDLSDEEEETQEGAGVRDSRRSSREVDGEEGHEERESVASVAADDRSDAAPSEGASRRESADRRRGGRSVHGGADTRRGDRKSFRCSSKQFAITYPQCDVRRDVFDELFRSKHKVAQYASAREQHEDGHWHLHLFVAFERRTDVQSSRYFDVSVDGKIYHPNVQSCRDRSAWLGYISKGTDHGVDELRRELEDPINARIGKRKATAADLKWTEEELIRRSLKPVVYPILLECEGKTYEMNVPDPKCKKRSWWIVAPPNAGKTRWINKQFARMAIYCPRMGKYPYEGYCDQDIIIYDDRKGVQFEELSDVLNTWEFLHPVYGEVRFTTQNWRMGHTRNVIVLSNKTIEQSFPEEDWLRVKKRFIQIVNPVLIPLSEKSDDDEEMKQAEPEFAQEFAS